MRHDGGLLIALGAGLGLLGSIFAFLSPVALLAPTSNVGWTPGVGLANPDPEGQRRGRRLGATGLRRTTMGWGAMLTAGLLAAAAQADEPPPRTSAVPIPPGQVETAVAAVDGLVADVMAPTGVPGIAVAVVVDGKVALAKGYGVRVAGEPAPVGPDTVFQLASLSKPVGATVVAHEVGRGAVAWDTAIASLLPWFALADPEVTRRLTLGDLYAHRSGLPDHAGDELEDLGYDRRAVLERLRLLPLAPFRASYAYTNFGLTAAAEAVATAAGTDWASLSETALYRPLGMASTSSRFADYIARPDRAVPHMRTGDGWAPREQRQPDAQSPAGGVSSTANDMAKWLTLLLDQGRPLVPPQALLAATMPQSVSGPPAEVVDRASFYGYGFNVGVSPSGRVTLGHSGAFYSGAATAFLAIPSANAGIVVLTNAQPVGAPEAVTLAFADLVQLGRVTRDWLAALEPLFAPMSAAQGHLAGAIPPIDPTPPGDLAGYVGTYDNPYFGPVEVAREGDGLVLIAGPNAMTFPLRHWSGTSFVLTPRGENAPDGSLSEVRFRGDEAGMTALTVEMWDKQGLGTFTR
jgi:CubicO group peptidase (beta-lactamase class C family)